MKNNDKIISDFYQEQKKFGYLESLNVHRNIEENSNFRYDLKITLFNYPYFSGDKKLVLIFYNIIELRIKDLEGLYSLLFSIIDVSSSQMEDISYKVKEEENDLCSFYCKKFEFFVV